jgi:hypothetical protein
LTGILPPNDNTGRGEGYIAFTVSPKAELTNGTVILNTATITFDWNDPINTPTVTNTLDSLPPSSQVAALPATMTNRTFTVTWSGQDDPGGSGLDRFDVYFSVDGGVFEPWLAGTTNTSADFTGVPGHTYTFYSSARDHAGNAEPPPAAAQATVSIAGDVRPFALTMLAPQNGQLSFRFPTQAGHAYWIETKTSLLAQGSWTTLTNFSGADSVFEFADRAGTNAPRFYRVRVQ